METSDLIRRLRVNARGLVGVDQDRIEAADRIEALQARVAQLEQVRRDFRDEYLREHERAEAAERRAAAAEGDARRYRWLHEQAETVSPRASTVFRKNGEWANVWDGASLDAAIDAAIAAQDAKP